MTKPLAFLAALFVPIAVQSQVTISAARALDGRGAAMNDVFVTIQNGRIDRIEPGVHRAATYPLGDVTLMPGLIDDHVHIGWFVDRNGKRNGRGSPDTPAQAALVRAGNLYQTLIAGFTTVQSVGGGEDIDLRDATARNVTPGPRILTSIAQLTQSPGAPPISPDSLRASVRRLKEMGADLIKLFASAGLGGGGGQTMSDEQLQAICGEAKAQGLRTVVHAISAQSVRASVLAGCGQIEHGTYVTDAELKLMAERGTIFDPQVCLVFQNYIDHPAAYNMNDTVVALMKATLPTAATMFRKAIATPGLKIVFGTDAVALAHGRNADELVCRVGAGQKPMDAIVSATSAAAASLGLGDQIGSLAPRYQADIIAVAGDPLADITAMKKVTFVMRAGRVYR